MYQEAEIAGCGVVVLDEPHISGLELCVLELDIFQVGLEEFLLVAHDTLSEEAEHVEVSAKF